MRNSERTRHIIWEQTPEIDAARTSLDQLFSCGDVYIFRHKLTPGEGYVSNNLFQVHSGSRTLAPITGRAYRSEQATWTACAAEATSAPESSDDAARHSISRPNNSR